MVTSQIEFLLWYAQLFLPEQSQKRFYGCLLQAVTNRFYNVNAARCCTMVAASRPTCNSAMATAMLRASALDFFNAEALPVKQRPFTPPMMPTVCLVQLLGEA